MCYPKAVFNMYLYTLPGNKLGTNQRRLFGRILPFKVRFMSWGAQLFMAVISCSLLQIVQTTKMFPQEQD